MVKSKEEIIKDIRRLLLQNDFNVKCVFETTEYMMKHLETNLEMYQKDQEKNPAHFCLGCDKYLGHRGFCSEKCHDKWYDEAYSE